MYVMKAETEDSSDIVSAMAATHWLYQMSGTDAIIHVLIRYERIYHHYYIAVDQHFDFTSHHTQNQENQCGGKPVGDHGLIAAL